MLTGDLSKINYTAEEIDKMVTELAAKIDEDYAGKEIIMAATLKGAMVFTTDLMRKLKKCAPVLDTIVASSYGNGTTSSGQVKIKKDLDTDIKGKDVLVVEDIIDSGVTMSHLLPMLRQRGANSVKLCALLSKPARRKVEIDIDYLGNEIPDEFIVGYGLDYAERYRNLPYIGVLKPEIYS